MSRMRFTRQGGSSRGGAAFVRSYPLQAQAASGGVRARLAQRVHRLKRARERRGGVWCGELAQLVQVECVGR
eukprot:6204664-Pleurochrysis_carterae.AAC.2